MRERVGEESERKSERERREERGGRQMVKERERKG